MNRLPLRTHLGYGLGDFGQNLLFQTVGFFLLSFYTDVMGLSAAFAANIFLLTRIWDGINDPMMGWLAQRTRTRWGTFRPYLLWMAGPLALMMALLFWVPPLEEGGKQWYAVLTYVGFTMAFTAMNIPFGALTAVLTADARERSRLTGFRMTMGMLGGVLAAVAFLPLVGLAETHTQGYLMAAVVFGVVMVACLFQSFRSMEEQVQAVPKEAPSWSAIRKGLWQNRPFWLLCGVFGSCFVAYAIFASSLPYFATYYLEFSNLTSGLLLTVMGTTATFVPIWAALARRIGKKATFLWGMLGYFGGLGGMAILPIDQLPILFVLMGLYGIGNAAAVFGSWAMVADTVEFGEWKTGLRLEGMRYGIYGFFIKLGIGLGLWLAGKSLDWWGYVPNAAQDAVAVGGIRQLVSVVPLAWVLVAWLLMWRYSLTEGRHEKIRADLVVAEAGTAG